MLVQIESLADAKDDEEEQLEDHMQEIKDKKKLLQNEINRLQSEMNNFKAQICNEPLHAVNPKALNHKVKFCVVWEAFFDQNIISQRENMKFCRK